MNRIIFSLPGNEELAGKLSQKNNCELGEAIVRRFPDGESYVRIISPVKDKEVILVCTLNQPDEKFLSLYFFARAAKTMGAKKVGLILPYLSYMRQDKSFLAGEAVTSEYFARLISEFSDWMLTVEPHLHRRESLNEIYNTPCKAIHVTSLISEWIKINITKPILIGPDSESKQWVAAVAADAAAPFIILEKKREGDRDVKISIPNLAKFKQHTPVLVDDIISTAGTMIKTIEHLKTLELLAPVCIGVHAVFAQNSYTDLKNAGAGKIITCNTIPHESNAIDVSSLLDINF